MFIFFDWMWIRKFCLLQSFIVPHNIEIGKVSTDGLGHLSVFNIPYHIYKTEINTKQGAVKCFILTKSTNSNCTVLK
jgi:hypothetical protein